MLLIVPCLLFLALCTVQLTAYATAVASATHVATEAATVAAARGASPVEAMAAVNEGLAGIGAVAAGASRIDVDGDRVTVHVSVAVPRIVPVGPLHVVRSATVVRERFVAYPER